MRVALISDTHGCHRQLRYLPVTLIHGGDFTRMGREEDAVDFNDGSRAAPRTRSSSTATTSTTRRGRRARRQCSNASFLRDTAVTLPNGLRVHGTGLLADEVAQPNLHAVADGSADVLVCHGPVAGYVDGGSGCAELLRLVRRLRPRLVVSGHIHASHAVVEGRGGESGTTFVNAANAHRGHAHMGWEPVVVDL